MFYILIFNIKRYIRLKVNNIKAKIKGINVNNAFKKRKKEFIIGILNFVRTEGMDKTIPAIKIKRILLIIY